MVWSVIPTILPQDNLTSDWLSTYVHDNLLEAENEAITGDDQMITTAGLHSIRGSQIQQSAVATSTFTTTSTTPVAITSPTLTVTQQYFIVWYGGLMSSSSSTANVGPAINGVTGAESALSRAVRINSSAGTTTCMGAYFFTGAPAGSKTIQLYGWITPGGSATLTVNHRWMTIIPL